MKILLLTGSLNQGGAEYQLLLLAKLLQKNNYNVEVLAITDYDYYMPFVNANVIRYSCVSNDGKNLIRLIRALRLINSKKPDLVISYIKKVSQVAILTRVLSFFRFKLIISERTGLIRCWHDFYYFNLALLSTRVTVNSISKLNYIKKRFPLLKSRAVFMPNLIELDKFLKVEMHYSANDITRLSYVGRISPEKNLLNLIKGVKIVSERGYKISLYLYGEANNLLYLEEIQNLISHANVESYIEYSGPVQDVTGIYGKTDLLCLVSFYEGFSNVLAEALASGLIVVASDIPENRYLIEDGRNGYLVNPGDVHCIAAGIERFLVASPKERLAISSQNRIRAKELFNEESTFKKYQNLFDAL